MSFRISGNAIVNVDSSLIQRAITNLVSNAIRYGTPNGVIDLNISSDESTVRFSVINHGEQIPVEHQVRLFDRFYRTEFSRAREAGGSGLGLSIVKAIMHLHRGSVEVQSNAHGETRFTLIFLL
jgi:two-component system heavy metal sensor histidine kinase CusS